MNCIVRKAVPEDAETMAELDRLCFTVPWTRQAFEHELSANEAAFYLVGLIEGEIVGYAGLWQIVDEGHITNIAVHPAYRRKGLGKLLLAELIRASEARGINKHTLEVRASNEAAIELYKKFGFKIAGIRKGYYPDNFEDALILWRMGEERQDLSRRFE